MRDALDSFGLSLDNGGAKATIKLTNTTNSIGTTILFPKESVAD